MQGASAPSDFPCPRESMQMTAKPRRTSLMALFRTNQDVWSPKPWHSPTTALISPPAGTKRRVYSTMPSRFTMYRSSCSTSGGTSLYGAGMRTVRRYSPGRPNRTQERAAAKAQAQLVSARPRNGRGHSETPRCLFRFQRKRRLTEVDRVAAEEEVRQRSAERECSDRQEQRHGNDFPPWNRRRLLCNENVQLPRARKRYQRYSRDAGGRLG